ncbi:hypothetical protein SLNSH_00570 [Alsobacter soli]|uniref:Uncharacterized protein n=1 Tax=Alsobacter soli TaxID=2109933 RepID=A0A2T1HYZ0_9HYPH|nr:hypothetical protein SLNSH_00570 [Alsobacter soli]
MDGRDKPGHDGVFCAIASEAKRSSGPPGSWIASSLRSSQGRPGLQGDRASGICSTSVQPIING